MFFKYWHIFDLGSKTSNNDNYLMACIEEYKTLREESRQASVNMITSMSIGIGVAALAMVTGITSTSSASESAIPIVILCGIIPFLLALITSFWLGEAARFKRAGDYICFIEFKISIILDEFYANNIEKKWKENQEKFETELKIPHTKLPLGRPMQWEHWLRDVGHMKSLYAFRLGLLIIAFLAPLAIGIGYAIRSYSIDCVDINCIANLFNRNPIIVLWVLFITVAYFVFVFSYTAKLKVKPNPISFDEILSHTKSGE